GLVTATGGRGGYGILGSGQPASGGGGGVGRIRLEYVQSLSGTTNPPGIPTVSPPALVVSTTSPLPGATLATPYSVTLAATGGTPSYTWSVTGGQLPAGIALDATAGTLSGAPTTAGTATFIAQVRDAGGTTAAAQLTLLVTAPQPVIGGIS